MFNSREKGAIGERQVAAMLKDWWKSFEPGAEFVKTPGSGGWHGKNIRGASIRKGHNVSGDVSTSSSTFPFCVEVKRVEAFNMENFLSLNPMKVSPVWNWWTQAIREAHESDKNPMLWFRRNREPWMIMIPLKVAQAIALPPPMVAWSTRELLSINYGGIVPILFLADDLLKVEAKEFVNA